MATRKRSGEVALPGRDTLGRFTKDNPAAMVHGADSEVRKRELEPVRHDEVAGVLAGLGYGPTTDEPTRPLLYLVEQLVEARLIASTYWEFLVRSGGPITTKGRQRRAVDGYFRAADRVAKFAAMLGLERRTTTRDLSTMTAAEYARATEDDHHEE